MYIHTTHTHTLKEGKAHAENMTQKNQRLGKPHYQVWATSLWNILQDYLSESQNGRDYQQTSQLPPGGEVAPLRWKTQHLRFITQLTQMKKLDLTQMKKTLSCGLVSMIPEIIMQGTKWGDKHNSLTHLQKMWVMIVICMARFYICAIFVITC